MDFGLLSASYSAAMCMDTRSEAKKDQLQKRAAGFPHSSEAFLGFVEALLTLDAYLLLWFGAL